MIPRIADLQPLAAAGAPVWLIRSNGSHQRPPTHLNSFALLGELDWAPTGRTLVIKASFDQRAAGPSSGWSSAGTGSTAQLTQHAALAAGAVLVAERCAIAFPRRAERDLAEPIWRLSLRRKQLVSSPRSPAALYVLVARQPADRFTPRQDGSP